MFYGELIDKHGVQDAADKAIDKSATDIMGSGWVGDDTERAGRVAMRSIISLAFSEINMLREEVKWLTADLARAEKGVDE